MAGLTDSRRFAFNQDLRQYMLSMFDFASQGRSGIKINVLIFPCFPKNDAGKLSLASKKSDSPRTN